MARRASGQPTDGELKILKVLWEMGPSRLSEICAALRQHQPTATTTVATILGIMLQKGLVERKSGSPNILWSAKLSQQDASSGLLKNLMEGVFDGSAQKLVAHLLQQGELSDKDRQAIRGMFDGRYVKEKSKRRNRP